MRYFGIILFCAVLISCQRQGAANPVVNTQKAETEIWERTIIIQPFVGFPAGFTDTLFQDIRKIEPEARLNPPIPLPDVMYWKDSSIYKADSLVAYLDRMSTNGNIVIGLTDRKIGIGKYKIKEIMGLANRPGYSCVVSTSLLSKKNTYEQLYKLSLHELAHAQGVAHCRRDSTCYMSNANGANPWDVETGFCPRCKAYLVKLGWQLR